jgi:hypothetical protein
MVALLIVGASHAVPKAFLGEVPAPAIWMTLDEASADAARDGEVISPSTLRGQIRNGRIPVDSLRKVGNVLQITRSAFYNYLESRAPTIQRTRRAKHGRRTQAIRSVRGARGKPAKSTR